MFLASVENRKRGKKSLCAITVSVKTCPFWFFMSRCCLFAQVMTISNIAVVFSDVAECYVSDHCGSIKSFCSERIRMDLMF